MLQMGVGRFAEFPVAGVTIILCQSCVADVNANADSYGEEDDGKKRRFQAILRRFIE